MMDTSSRRHRILILGGGFGGLYVALELQLRGVAARTEVTLVNASEHFLFTPLLYELLTEEIKDWHIAPHIRDILPSTVQFVLGEATHIDVARKRVEVSGGSALQVLEYDSLVLALGSESPRSPMEFPADRLFFFRTLDDARALVHRLHLMVEQAKQATTLQERERRLSFAIIGAGPSGVEISGKLSDALQRNLRLQGLNPKDAHVTLIDRNEKILKGYATTLSPFAEKALDGQAVSVRLGAGVARHTPYGVLLENGERVAGNTLIWTAGGAPPAAQSLSLLTDRRGRIAVGRTLEAPGHQGVFALGDNAFLSETVPATAQVAVRQAQVVAANIEARRTNGPMREYEYIPLGEMLTLGRYAAAANVFGICFDGCPAHLFRRIFYLSSMPNLGHSLRVGVDWAGRAVDDFFQLRPPFASSGKN